MFKKGTNISLLTEFDRNHIGLVTNTYLTINGGIREKISTQTYDAINRLLQKTILPDGTFTAGGFQDYINRSTSPASAMDDIAKKAICLLPGVLIGGSNIPYSATINPNGAGGTTIIGLQKMDYIYHIRGGLRGINLDANQNPTPNEAQGDLYSYKLDYETANQWNGNIGKQSWNNQNQLRGYDFNYDPSQRLTNANYFGAASENYNLNDLTFDDNGNIKSLKRYGKGNSSYGLQDNLTYYYQGNRLLGLTDAAGHNHGNTYHKDNGSSSDYTYYSNGSLKTDGNRSITNIDYQTYLNKTAQVNFADGTWLKNYYDGGGSLIKREKSTTETWQYIDRFVFKNGQLYSINIPDGRLIKNGANWEKEFYYKDHLGSSVVTFSAQNGNLVAKEYAPVDPFGLELFGINQANSTYDNFTYQSKEKLDDFGIFGTNDFGARVFDKFSLKFLGVDPMAEKAPSYSPYVFNNGDPINRIDLDGRFSIKNHYKFTSNALSSLGGYSSKQMDAIAHYASVYADHPAKWITYQQGLHYRSGIDYSGTLSSQNTGSKISSSWHSMAADGESISSKAAMNRGQEFGWGKIIQSGTTKGTKQLEAIGQGIHALQDAIAHQGTNMDNHDIVNDMYPSQSDVSRAEAVTRNAMIVSEVIGGNFSHLTNGMTIDLSGANKKQFETIKNAFQKAVDSNKSDDLNKVYFNRSN